MDKLVHLSTLKHLVTVTTLTDFDPTLVRDCFNDFIGCIKAGVNNGGVVIVQGLEPLATVSAQCLFNTISHLSSMDPTSSVLEDIRQQYIEIIPSQTSFDGHTFYYTMNAVHCLFVQHALRGPALLWDDFKPSADEHTTAAHNLEKLAQFKYQKSQQAQRPQGPKVPRWTLRFALHSLSMNPPPSTSVVAHCLLIIALDLGCDVPNPGTTTSDKRWVRV
jgi:hypothetical protein